MKTQDDVMDMLDRMGRDIAEKNIQSTIAVMALERLDKFLDRQSREIVEDADMQNTMILLSGLCKSYYPEV